MRCLLCHIAGCDCLFTLKLPNHTGTCLLCAGAPCPLEKKVEIESKREALAQSGSKEKLNV